MTSSGTAQAADHTPSEMAEMGIACPNAAGPGPLGCSFVLPQCRVWPVPPPLAGNVPWQNPAAMLLLLVLPFKAKVLWLSTCTAAACCPCPVDTPLTPAPCLWHQQHWHADWQGYCYCCCHGCVVGPGGSVASGRSGPGPPGQHTTRQQAHHRPVPVGSGWPLV